MTAEEQRIERMRPYRALLSAIVLQAVSDVKHAGYFERSKAAHWLLRSEVCSEMLIMLDIDPHWFRARLRTKSWFTRALGPEARLFNPLLQVAV
jgi:hypothetical protein